jgi:hypothetical protein
MLKGCRKVANASRETLVEEPAEKIMGHAPTEQETKQLEEIEARLKLLDLSSHVAVLLMLLLVGSLIVAPEQYQTVKTILVVAIALALVGTLVYRTCFLRCPRCAGWIVLPKCPCGVKLEKYVKR